MIISFYYRRKKEETKMDGNYIYKETNTLIQQNTTMPVAEPASNSLERLIEMLPELIDQVSGLVQKKKEKADELPE